MIEFSIFRYKWPSDQPVLLKFHIPKLSYHRKLNFAIAMEVNPQKRSSNL